MENVKFEVVKVESGVAIANFEEMKTELESILKNYNNYVVTAENVDFAKKDRALLNNVSKAIDDERKRVKKIIMQQYDEVFEPQCKTLTGMILEVSKTIDTQVKELEELEKTEKRDVINKLWLEQDFKLVGIEKVFNPKWLNKTTTPATIQKEMEKSINQIKQDLTVLENFEDVEDLKAKYLISLKLAETIASYNAEKEAKARLSEKVETEVVEVEPIEIVKEKMQSVTIKVFGSENNMKKLRNLLENNGFTFEQLSDLKDEITTD